MKKFKNHQSPRRKYRFDILDNKKALKIWWDSSFKAAVEALYCTVGLQMIRYCKQGLDNHPLSEGGPDKKSKIGGFF